MPTMSESSSTRTPVNILTGFLGAGKTTLLNRLLQQGFGGDRVAVVVNDFGKIAVDALLIEHEEEGILSLPNGCVCCTLAGDLMGGLDGLLQAGYDRIVLEASGLTKIGDLRAIIGNPSLADRCFLETVVAVVDPARFVKLRAVVATIDEQVSGANVIVLNRADVASDGEMAEARAVVTELHPEARILESSFCEVTMDELRGGGGPRSESPAPSGDDHWTSFTVRFADPVVRDELQAALRQLPDAVFRSKGFVRAEDGEILHVEWAGGAVRIESWDQNVPPEALDALIIIGRETLTQGDLEAVLAAFPGLRYEQTSSDHSHHHKHHHHH